MKISLLFVLLAVGGSMSQRVRQRVPQGGRQSTTITLPGGELLTINAATLNRIQAQGVDVNNLQNLSPAELSNLGIRVSSQTLNARANVNTGDGVREITLRGGQILTIDSATLARLESQGVDINNIGNLSEAELTRIGITVRKETIETLAPGTTRTITFEGQIITIQYETLLRLLEQGIDIDNLQALSGADLERLGIITISRTITVARPVTVTRPATSTRTIISAFSTPSTPTARPAVRPIPTAAPRRAPTEEERNPAPEPFSFTYSADNEDGSSTTEERTQTADGVVKGWYLIKDKDGSERRVDYIADADGYRATITTNEPGTESHSPADAEIISSSPSASELSRQWTLDNPQGNQQRRQRQSSNLVNLLSTATNNVERESATEADN